GRPQQDHVLCFSDERAGGQVREHVTAQRGQVVEVEVLQCLHGREVGGADAHDGAFGLPVGDLALQQGGQVLLVRPVLVAGLGGELFPECADGGGLQCPGQVGDHRRHAVLRRGGLWFGLGGGAHAFLASVVGLVKSTPNRAS